MIGRFLASFFLALLLLVQPAFAQAPLLFGGKPWLVGGAPAISGAAAAQTFVSLSLSNQSFVGGVAGAVGTLTTAMSPVSPAFSGTQTLVSSGGSCTGGGGDDTTHFSTALASGAWTLSTTGPAPGSYLVCVKTAQAGISNLPTYTEFTITGSASSGAVYYVNASAGSDMNNGTSISTPWASITRVNQGPTGGYTAGTTIAFAGGQTFIPSTTCSGTAENLYFNSSNISSASPPSGASPLTIENYGTGAATIVSSCPGVDNGTHGPKSAAVLFTSISGIVWNGVNVSANGTATQYGIGFFTNASFAPYGAITVENATVTGFHLDNSASADGSLEIYVSNRPITGNPTPATACGAVSTVTILNNNVGGAAGPTSPDDNGIYIGWGGTCSAGTPENITNLTFAGNTISNLGSRGVHGALNVVGYGEGMGYINGCLISSNLAYALNSLNSEDQGGGALSTYDANDCTVTYNEVYNVGASAIELDGMALNFGQGSTNCVYEFNYTHNNYGAGVVFFVANADVGAWTNNTYAYNISDSDVLSTSNGFDPGSMSFVNSTGSFTPGADDLNVYNNTIYQPGGYPGQAPIWSQTVMKPTGYIANNILEGDSYLVNIAYGDGGTVTIRPTFLNNAYVKLGTRFAAVGGQYETTYTTLAAWQTFLASNGGEVGATTASPHFAGSPPAGNATWTPSSGSGPNASANLGVYKLTGSSTAYVGMGLNLAASPYNLTLPATDFFGDTIPNGTGTGYNIGADGGNP